MATIGFEFLSSILTKPDLKQVAALGDLSDLFASEGEIEVYNAIKKYIDVSNKVPPKDIIEKETAMTLPTVSGDVAYYHHKLIGRFVHNSLTNTTTDMSKFLVQGSGYDPEKALTMMENQVLQLRLRSEGHHNVSDFRDAFESVWEKYKHEYKTGIVKGITSGWPTVDEHSRGLLGGDLGSIVGRPETGKTFLMLYSALHAWIVHKVVTVFFTQEMPAITIKQRMAAIYAKAPLTPLKSVLFMSPEEHTLYKEALQSLHDVHQVPFWVIDGRMASTVDDIYMHSAALGAESVWIDGGYLLKHRDMRMDRYRRVAENVDLLKGTAIQLDVPITASWQFSKEQKKKQKKNADKTPDLEDIGYSDAIAQHSSLVLGLVQNEAVDTLQQRKVFIMKGRDGQIGQFNINWNMLTSDFSEKPDLAQMPVSELQLKNLG